MNFRKLASLPVSLFFVALLIFSLLPISTKAAENNTDTNSRVSINLELNRTRTTIENQFDILVKLDSQIPSRGIQFSMNFDPSLFRIINVAEGDYLAGIMTGPNEAAYFKPGKTDNENGELSNVLLFLAGTEEAVSAGQKILATITMEQLSDDYTGKAIFALSDIIAISHDYSEITDVSVNTIEIAGKTDTEVNQEALEFIEGLSFSDKHDALIASGAVEMEQERDSYGRKYQMPDGCNKILVSSGAIQYQTPKGGYELIDNTLVACNQGGYSYTNKANSFSVFFPSEAGAEPGMNLKINEGVELHMGSQNRLSIHGADNELKSSRNAGQSIAFVENNAVSFADRYPGITESYRVLNYGLKHEYIISQSQDYMVNAGGYSVAFSETITLPQGTKITCDGTVQKGNFTTSGEITLIDKNGESIGFFPAPTAYESDTATGESSKETPFSLSYNVVFLEDNLIELSVIVPVDWLSDKERSYPVIIDPTYYVSSSADDGYEYLYYDSGVWNPQVNYNSSVLWVGNQFAQDATHYISYMRWQNVQIPAGSIIDSTIFMFTAAAADTDICSFEWVFEATDNAQPLTGTMPQFRSYVTDHAYADGYGYPWNTGQSYGCGLPALKSGLQEVISRPGWTAGNALGMKWGLHLDAYDGKREVCSYDHGVYGPPYLEITYHAGTPPSITTDGTSAVTETTAYLHATLTSTGSASTVYVGFEYGLTAGYGYTIGPYPKMSTGAFAIGISDLAPDTTYHYRAIAIGHGTAYGIDQTFDTLPTPTPPTVRTDPATNVTSPFSKQLNGYLLDLGTASPVCANFEYWPSGYPQYTLQTNGTNMTSSGAFSENSQYLGGGFTFYFKAKADGDGAPVYGAQQSITIPASSIPNWDVNGDGVCDVLDLNITGNLTGAEGPAGWLRADVIEDGDIDALDIGYISDHLGETWNEIGATWIDDGLPNAETMVENFYIYMTDWGWEDGFIKGDRKDQEPYVVFENNFTDVDEKITGRDHEAGGVDSVDILFHDGHGKYGRLYLVDNQSDDCTVSYFDCAWGDNDLEWIMLHACQTLRDDGSDNTSYQKSFGLFARALDGVRIICGAYTSMLNTGNDGYEVAHRLIDDDGSGPDEALTVINSWFLGIDESHGAGKILRCLAEAWEYGEYDYIWGQSTGPYTPKLPIDDYYWEWTWNCT